MPLAVTHVLLTIICVDLFRDYILADKKYFTLHTLFIAGVAGILPDIDIPLKALFDLLSVELPQLLQHGGLFHTPFIALLFFLGGLLLWFEKRKQWAVYGFVIAFGITFHIFLDFLLGGGNHNGVMFLFPFSMNYWKVHLLLRMPFSGVIEGLDAIILLLWLWHEEIKHKISDFF